MIENFTTWFAMGGYAGFIWASYGASVLGLGGLGVLSWRDYLKAQKMISKSGDAS